MNRLRSAFPLFVAALPAVASADTTVTTFSNGAQGWYVSGGGSIPATGGNPGHCQRIFFNDFGVGCANATNAPYLGDYTTAASVTIKIDLKVSQISFFGQPVSRPWLLELRDLDGASGGYPYNSVYFVFANVSAATHGSWTTFSVTFDPSSKTLPPGWGGTGAWPGGHPGACRSRRGCSQPGPWRWRPGFGHVDQGGKAQPAHWTGHHRNRDGPAHGGCARPGRRHRPRGVGP